MGEKEAARRTEQAVVVAMYPDVCRAPTAPTPFQITALLSDTEGVSPDVMFTKMNAATMGTYVTRVRGDEPGSGGGTASGVNVGYCRPVEAQSSTVKVNKQEVLRHDTVFEMNCPSPTGTGNTKGKLVYATSAPSATVCSDGTIQGNTNPPPNWPQTKYLGPVIPSQAAGFQQQLDRVIGTVDAVTAPVIEGGRQVGGFFYGLGAEVIGGIVGLAQMGLGAAQLSADTSPVGYASDWAFGGAPPSWLPSAIRGQQTMNSIGQLGSAIWNQPSLIWDGIKDPVVSAWAAGNYGEAIGRGVGMGADLVVGTHGLMRAGSVTRVLSRVGLQVDSVADVLTVARRADAAMPGSFARALDETVAFGRANNGLDTVVAASRKSGTLDELLSSGKLTRAEIEQLRKTGKLSDVEAAKAEAATINAGRASGTGPDGVVVNKTPPKIYDASDPSLHYNEVTYRGNKTPLDEGGDLAPRKPDGNLDVATHQAGNDRWDSQWVSSSKDPGVASNFGDHVHVVNQNAGVDVNRALGFASQHANELEVLHHGGISIQNVVGTYVRGPTGWLFQSNPIYRGPGVLHFPPGGP
jgi:hypothetical protein